MRSSPGATSPAASSAIQVGVGAGAPPSGIWICSSPGDGPTGLRLGATPSTSRPEQVGRGLVDRLLDRQLERRRRRRAAVAVADEAQPRDAVLEPEQLDVAAVGLHVRAHASRAPRCTRVSSVDRVEVVDQQQARRPRRRSTSRSRIAWPASRPRRARATMRAQPLAVQLDDRADESSATVPRTTVGRAPRAPSVSSCDALEQLLLGGCARSLDCQLGRPSAEAGRPVHDLAHPARARCTCARRTAGTGRTSARRA